MKPHSDSTYRAMGIAGLTLLLAITLWAQRDKAGTAQQPTAPLHTHDDQSPPPEPGRSRRLASGQLQDGVRVVNYDAVQYAFSPDPLVVHVGETVKLLLKSLDTKHGVMIPIVDVSVEMPLDTRVPVLFKAPLVPGEYPVFCSVFCGGGHGEMTGRFIVLPRSDEAGGEGSHDSLQ